MTAPDLAAAANYRADVIELYRGLIADAMLSRICTFTATPVFGHLARELAEHIGCDETFAAMQLYETSHEIYLAACKAVPYA
jgi:hypothetical protein